MKAIQTANRSARDYTARIFRRCEGSLNEAIKPKRKKQKGKEIMFRNFFIWLRLEAAYAWYRTEQEALPGKFWMMERAEFARRRAYRRYVRLNGLAA